MKKTVLQELIEHLETHLLRLDVPDMVYQIDGINEAIKKAKTLLPKEREDLEEAFKDGLYDFQFLDPKDYVNQTFEK